MKKFLPIIIAAILSISITGLLYGGYIYHNNTIDELKRVHLLELAEAKIYTDLDKNIFPDANGLFYAGKRIVCSKDTVKEMVEDLKKKDFVLEGVFLNGHATEDRVIFNQIWKQKNTNNISIMEFITTADQNMVMCLITYGYKYKEIEQKGF